MLESHRTRVLLMLLQLKLTTIKGLSTTISTRAHTHTRALTWPASST